MIQTASPGDNKMAMTIKWFLLELSQVDFEIAESLTAGFVIPAYTLTISLAAQSRN